MVLLASPVNPDELLPGESVADAMVRLRRVVVIRTTPTEVGWVSSGCDDCGQEVIRAREVDGRLLELDPAPDGGVVLYGDPAEPAALWGVDPAGEELPWGTFIPAGAPRYQEHTCRPAR